MKAPAPYWETAYAHTRRAHRHRCRCCSRIINAGEPVIQAKVRGGATFTIHTACGDKVHSPEGGWLWRDAMECWGLNYLKVCGFKVFDHPMNYAGSIKKQQGAA